MGTSVNTLGRRMYVNGYGNSKTLELIPFGTNPEKTQPYIIDESLVRSAPVTYLFDYMHTTGTNQKFFDMLTTGTK